MAITCTMVCAISFVACCVEDPGSFCIVLAVPSCRSRSWHQKSKSLILKVWRTCLRLKTYSACSLICCTWRCFEVASGRFQSDRNAWCSGWLEFMLDLFPPQENLQLSWTVFYCVTLHSHPLIWRMSCVNLPEWGFLGCEIWTAKDGLFGLRLWNLNDFQGDTP